MERRIVSLALGLALCGAFSSVIAQSEDGGLDAVKVRPNFYMIAGAGGNIGVQIGSDGVVVVDTGASERAEELVAAIKRLTDQPIRYVINTGPDADHIGGNAVVAKAGQSILTLGGMGKGEPSPSGPKKRRKTGSLGNGMPWAST